MGQALRQAAVHFALPEGKALLERHGIEHGQFWRRHGRASDLGHVAKGLVRVLCQGHGAVVALALGAVRDAEAVFLAVCRDGHAGLVVLDLVDLEIAAELPVYAGHVEGSLAGHGKENDVLLVDELFLQELYYGFAVAPLHHKADLFLLGKGKARADKFVHVGCGVVHIERAPHKTVHVLFGAHEEWYGVGVVVALLPANDHIEVLEPGLDGVLEIVERSLLACAERAQGLQGHFRHL